MAKSIKQLIRRDIDTYGAEWIDRQPVLLGDYTATVQTGTPGVFYARQYNGKVIEVHNTANVPPTFDLHVIVGRKKSLPTTWQIIEVRETYLSPAGGGQIGYHHEQHEFPNGDTVWVDRKQIIQLTALVQDAAGFIVLVYGATVRTASGIVKISSQTVDVSSYVPALGALFVSIETDDDGVITTNAGAAFGSRETGTAADIPVPAAGKYMIAFVLLYELQTELTDDEIIVPMPLSTNPDNFSPTGHTHDISETEERDYLSELVTLNAYAGAHINPQHYRWNALTSVTLSGTTYQAIGYWDSDGFLVIGKRVIDGAWTLYTTTILLTGVDNHDIVNIGIDPNGYIHVSYDMHAESLRYRKSDAPINTWTGTLGSAISMVGTNESAVTYPTFINDPAGALYFLFRDGVSGDGDLFFYKYNHSTTTWAAATGTGTGGKLINGKVSDVNPYWDHPAFDANFGSGGFLHLSWHWRDTGVSGNEDRSYVKWDGTNWKKADGSAQTVPITQANAEIFDAVSDNLGMTSANSLDSDSDGNPHIVYPKTVGGFRNLYHAYHNGSTWTITQLTTTNGPDYGDNSTYDIGLVPSIAIDRATDTVYIFYFDRLDLPGLLAMVSDPADFTSWERRVVYPYYPGWWGPKYDYTEWRRSTVIYFPIEFYQGVLLDGEYLSFPIRILKWDPDTNQKFAYNTPHTHTPVDIFDDSEGDPEDVTGGTEADGTSAFAARRDHVHHYEVPVTPGGGGHLHGLIRWVSSGGTTFDLPDVAEVLESVSVNGTGKDPTLYSLSSDRTQVVFDSAVTAADVVTAQYVLAQV